MDVTAFLCTALLLYLLVLVARILLSWFPIDPNGSMAAVAGFLYLVTDPILAPLRRAIPPLRIGNVALDLSTLVALIGIQLLRGIICSGA